MKRRRFLSLATASLSASAIGPLAARPRYGGTLRVHPAGLIESLGTPVSEACEIHHDASRRAWTLTVRPGLIRHDKSPVTVETVLQALKSRAADLAAAANSRAIVVTPVRSSSDVAAILENEIRVDCGPFIVHPADRSNPSSTSWAEAFEDHPDGRPYVDRIELASAPQAAHVAELAPGSLRSFKSPAHRIWTSQPLVLLAIDAAGLTPDQRTALSLAIDRDAIVRFILQGQGEPTGSLAPQWRTGYAFLFKQPRDVARARQLGRSASIALAHHAGDATARLIAERIALNARDAGIEVRPVAAHAANAANAAARIVRVAAPSSRSYESEKAAIEERGMIPIAHLPRVFAIHQRVQGWDEAHDRHRHSLRLEEIWLAP